MIVCGLPVNAPVPNVATPPPLSVEVPSVAAPSLKVTVPVGVPPALVTVAVNITLCPTTLGLSDDATATDAVCKMTEFVALPDTVVALLALTAAVSVTEPAGVPATT